MIFIDTSAIYALADTADPNHRRAVEVFEVALADGQQFLTHNYVVLESLALLQHRLGLSQAMRFAAEAAAFDLDWVSEDLHDRAVAWLRRDGRRHVSLVDAVSFAVMRARGVDVAFAFDPHFVRERFRLLMRR